MKNRGKVFFVDDEEHLRNSVAQTFQLADLDAETFPNGDNALAHISRDFSGIVVSDIRMPGISGMELLNRINEVDPELPVVLVTGQGDIKLAVEAMRAGAYDFIEKPFFPEHLIEVVRRALDKRRLILENRSLRRNASNSSVLERRLTGRSRVMQALRSSITTASSTDSEVLIIGETGTGKELVARAIHDLGDRSGGPFVVVNCGAISIDRMESELFGHEQGAFTGAFRSRIGKFEHAKSGTIFLDGLESAPVELQLKLLRLLEDKQIQRLGSNETIPLDVRIIAAATPQLHKYLENGKFRPDLYHRINTITLTVPPLSERPEDIPELFTQLTNEASIKFRRELSQVPSSLVSSLLSREWPGNVRELKNFADRHVLGITVTPTLQENELSDLGLSLHEKVSRFEKMTIEATLTANNGVIGETHKALGISRKSLYEKMQKYGLDKEQFRKNCS